MISPSDIIRWSEWLFLIVLVTLAFYNFRHFIFVFIATKFTADLFWNYPLFAGTNVSRILGVLFPIACLIYILINKKWPKNHPFMRIMLILVALNLISATWGLLNSHFEFFYLPATPLTYTHVLDWLFRFFNQFSAFLILPLILELEEDRRTFFMAFLISTVLPILVGYYQAYEIFINDYNPYVTAYGSRISAFYKDPGTLAFILAIGIISAVYVFLQSGRMAVLLTYALTAWFLLILTGNRTILLSLFLSVILILWVHNRKQHAILVGVALLVTTLASPFAMLRFDKEVLLFQSSWQSGFTEHVEKLGSGRIYLWKTAWWHFQDLDWISKIVGSGGSYGSHNQYINWILRNGVLGVTAFAYFLYNLLNTLRLKSGCRKELILCLCVLFVINIVAQPWDHLGFSIFFWGTLGFCYHVEEQ